MKKKFVTHKLFFVIYLLLCINIYARATSSELPEGWIEIKPGGLSKCARGEDFSFFYRQGKSSHIVIDFMGGGACWNSNTCSKSQATFIDSVDYIRKTTQKGLHGIYDHNNTENPIKEWSHLIIPYCTGDIHWGENDTNYTDNKGNKFTIHHRGALNVKSAINWLTEKTTLTEKILITGCSAGAYASLYWTPAIREIFPRTKIYQFGDSGAGITTQDFLKASNERWNLDQNSPFWIPELNPNYRSWKTIDIDHIYKSVAKYYPEVKFSQFNFSQDEVQKFFYELMNGDINSWDNNLKQSLYNIEDNLDNFIFYREKGTGHCVLPYPNFYQKYQNKISKSEWLRKFINDEDTQSIDCTNC